MSTTLLPKNCSSEQEISSQNIVSSYTWLELYHTITCLLNASTKNTFGPGTDLISLLIFLLLLLLLCWRSLKSLRLRRCQSDRYEIRQDCSSNKYASIGDSDFFYIWRQTFKICILCICISYSISYSMKRHQLLTPRSTGGRRLQLTTVSVDGSWILIRGQSVPDPLVNSYLLD